MTTQPQEQHLATAVEYLDASSDDQGETYTYHDHASCARWRSDAWDMQTLGEALEKYRTANAAGEIDPDSGMSESRVYSTWCGSSTAVEA